jgi:hypothetical protein
MVSKLGADDLWSRDSPPQTVKPSYNIKQQNKHAKIKEA